MLVLLTFLLLIPGFALGAVYLERKISAFVQDRTGPNRTGPYGLLQTLADILKLVQKENITPLAADKLVFALAPMLVFAAILTGFSILPLSPDFIAAPVSTGILLILAIISLDVIGIILAGWASNNKYSLLGAMRSVAQIISYEVPLGISILGVIMLCGSLDLIEISSQQGINEKINSPFLGIVSGINANEIGGVFSWNIFRMPILFIAFVLFFIATLAECNRAPFDIPEGESEIIGGFHTEYGGFRFALLFLSEYGMMLLVSFLAVILFLGSWHSPLPNISVLKLADWTNGDLNTLPGRSIAFFWLSTKTILLIFIQMLIRWTYPRMRIDQLMNLSWKYLTPIGLVVIFIVGIWKVII